MSEHAQLFPARFEVLSDALAFAAKSGADAGCSPDTCKRIELVIEELFTNTVDYGYANTPLPESSRTVRLSASTVPSGVQIVYEDWAPAFDPTDLAGLNLEQRLEDRQIGGLGRVLVTSLPNAATYERIDDRNRIILRFNR